jgi:hypothetical protein
LLRIEEALGDGARFLGLKALNTELQGLFKIPIEREAQFKLSLEWGIALY